jgi:hypothetical protein
MNNNVQILTRWADIVSHHDALIEAGETFPEVIAEAIDDYTNAIASIVGAVAWFGGDYCNVLEWYRRVTKFGKKPTTIRAGDTPMKVGSITALARFIELDA